jgi:hypothetical protein
MPSWGPWLAALSGLAAVVLFCGAFATPKDDGSRLFPRETIGLCAIGLGFLATAMLVEPNGRTLYVLVLIGAILATIGGRLFAFRRRGARSALK